jgi:NitT/TauT family transport system substrate-binding protein
LLKGPTICVAPQYVAEELLQGEGFTDVRYISPAPGVTYEEFLASGDVPCTRWREYDPHDTVRFQALRLHELGVIKTSPQKLIAQGTDWRFLAELKRELKS